MRTSHVASVFLVLSILTCQDASAQPAKDGRFTLMDIFQLEFASDPQISPDGKRVVYVRNSMDIWKDRLRSQLWMIGSDGKDHRPFTTGERKESSPRWSPDGTRVAFVTEADGRFQLRSRWLEGGQEAKLADLEPPAGNPVWSPDGKQIAFSMHVADAPKPFFEMPKAPKGAQWAEPPKVISSVNFRFDGKGYLKPGYQHLFVVSAESGTPRQLTSGPYQHADAPVWTPDGKGLLFSVNRRLDWELEPLNSDIYEVTVADKALRILTKRDGPDHSPAISPDGSRIVYVGFDDKRQGHQVTRLYVMSNDGANHGVLLKEFDRDVKQPRFSKDGKGVFFQYDDQGNTRIGFVSAQGKLRKLADHVGGTTLDRPYASGSFSVADDAKVAFTFSTPDHPADVAIVPGTGSPSPLKGEGKASRRRRLTSLNADLFENKKLGTTEEMWFTSSHDSRKIHAWIVKPADFDAKKKYPLILEIHGGPFANYGPRFSVNMQLFAAAGYVVLYVNPRGSTSYGQEFGNLIHHNYPGNDYDDLMSGVDALIKQGCIDEKNLFVTGGSGGGVLSAWIIGKTKRFRAAVVGKPVINWFSFVLTADIYPFFNRYWFPGYPWDNAEHYLKRSPISLAGNISTPTMIVTGEEDHRTPMSESEQLYQALKLRKIDAMLVRMPGASHNIAARPSQLLAWVGYTLRWFETHKAGK